MTGSDRSTHQLEIGRVVKPHGIRGEVSIAPTTNRPEVRFAAGARLWVGDRVYEVAGGRPHQDRWIVRLEGVADRNAAEELRGELVAAEPLDEGSDTLWVHDLVGCRVVTTDGREAGTVEAVEANPASDLLVLDSGALVPLRFLVDRDGSVLTVEVPEGLLEL